MKEKQLKSAKLVLLTGVLFVLAGCSTTYTEYGAPVMQGEGKGWFKWKTNKGFHRMRGQQYIELRQTTRRTHSDMMIKFICYADDELLIDFWVNEIARVPSSEGTIEIIVNDFDAQTYPVKFYTNSYEGGYFDVGKNDLEEIINYMNLGASDKDGEMQFRLRSGDAGYYGVMFLTDFSEKMSNFQKNCR